MRGAVVPDPGLTLRLARLLTAFLVLVAITGTFALSGYMASSLTVPQRKPLPPAPATLGIDYSDVEFTAWDGVVLRGWYLPARNGACPECSALPTVVLLHGWKSTRGEDDLGMPVAATLRSGGMNVLMYDHRAHGVSDGGRSSLGYFESRDVSAAIDWLEQRGTTGPIGVMGFSLGGAIAILATASDWRIQALATDSAFGDLSKILEIELPKASGLPSLFNAPTLLMGRVLYGIDIWAVRGDLAAARVVPRPFLIVHGTADDFVPLDHAHAIARAAPGADLWMVPGAKHVQAIKVVPEEYRARVLAFFRTALAAR